MQAHVGGAVEAVLSMKKSHSNREYPFASTPQRTWLVVGIRKGMAQTTIHSYAGLWEVDAASRTSVGQCHMRRPGRYAGQLLRSAPVVGKRGSVAQP